MRDISKERFGCNFPSWIKFFVLVNLRFFFFFWLLYKIHYFFQHRPFIVLKTHVLCMHLSFTCLVEKDSPLPFSVIFSKNFIFFLFWSCFSSICESFSFVSKFEEDWSNFFLIKKTKLFKFQLKSIWCKWKEINLIIFYLFTLVYTCMQVYMKGLHV